MTEQKKQEIRRLEKLHGVKVGERVKLRIQSTLRDEEVDSDGDMRSGARSTRCMSGLW